MRLPMIGLGIGAIVLPAPALSIGVLRVTRRIELRPNSILCLASAF